MTRLLYALLCACAATSLHAAELAGGNTLIAQAKKKKRSTKSFYVPSNSDEQEPSFTSHDDTPDFGLGGMLGYYYIGIGMGADLWWITPHRDLSLGLRVMQSQGELTSKDRNDLPVHEVLDTTMRTTSLYGRYLVGSSLNVTIGLTQATLTGAFGYKTREPTVHDTFVDFTAKRLMLEVSLGQQWRLITGHVLAIDWLGFGAALTDEVTLGSDVAAPDGSRVQDRVMFFENTTVARHVKRQLRDQIFAYGLMFKFGMDF